MPFSPVKVLLVDDHQIVLDSLSMLLSTCDEVQIVGNATSGARALTILELKEADILITDQRMPGMSGTDLCLQVRRRFPKVRIMMLSMAEDAAQIKEAIKAGVMGYVLKKADAAELIRAIRIVADGKKYFSEEVILELASAAGENLDDGRPETISRLTSREMEVLCLIAKEFSTNEIAEKLFISVPTVETHRRNLFQKLEVKSAVGVALYAIRHNLID